MVAADAPAAYTGVAPDAEWAREIRRLAEQRDAVLLAHNYQLPEIQDVADHTGDSLALTVWGSLSSWTLTALPLFIWMGEILLKTEMSAGHGGVSGRYAKWKQTAFEYAWTLVKAGAV